MRNSWSARHDSQVFVAGGECDERTVGGELYAHYPRLALVGEISLTSGQPAATLVY